MMKNMKRNNKNSIPKILTMYKKCHSSKKERTFGRDGLLFVINRTDDNRYLR